MKYLKRSLLFVVLALSLSACGVRGSLEAPSEDVADNGGAAPVASKPKTHKPFILDGLIR